MSIKIKELTLGKGITADADDMIRLAECKNLILENGALRKRGGIFAPLKLQDEAHKPKRINGIFGYGNEILVHAGQDLYACTRDLSIKKRLDVKLADEKTSGFVADSMLYIVGGGDLYAYTGDRVLSVGELERTYIPITRESVYDQYGQNAYKVGESPNLLTTKRASLLIGTSAHRDKEQKPTYLLEGEIKEGSTIEIEVKIRLRATGMPEDDFTSNVKGVGVDGLETQEIVIIRFKTKYQKNHIVAFPSEPIVDLLGNEIFIKNENDEPLTYDKTPLGVSIKGDRITFGFDVPTYEQGTSNIKITYETENQISRGDIKVCTLCPRDTGSRAIVFSIGDNRLFFSDTVKNNDYVPINNVVYVGTGGEIITSLVEMSNGVLGVFTNLGFYKVSLFSDGRGHQVFNSADRIGAESSHASVAIGGDVLTLYGDCVYGTHSSSPYMEQVGYFYKRGSCLENKLRAISIEARKNSCGASYKGKYFLFVGETTLIADVNQRTNKESSPSGAYEYEWYEWDGINARCALSFDNTLYIGRENGTVGYLTNEYLDKDVEKYSEAEMTLALTPQSGHTGITIDTGASKSRGTRAILSSHEVLISKGVAYQNGEYFIPMTDLFDKNGIPRLLSGQRVIIYDYGDRVVSNAELGQIDLLQGSFKIEGVIGDDTVFPLSLYLVRDSYEYDFRKEGLHYCLSENGSDVIFNSTDTVLFVIEQRPIVAVAKTNPIRLGDRQKRYTLLGAYIHLTKETTSQVEYEWESQRHRGKSSFKPSTQIDFNSLDFSTLSFEDNFIRDYYLPSLERNIRYLSVEIKSQDSYPFGIRGIGLRLIEHQD